MYFYCYFIEDYYNYYLILAIIAKIIIIIGWIEVFLDMAILIIVIIIGVISFIILLGYYVYSLCCFGKKALGIRFIKIVIIIRIITVIKVIYFGFGRIYLKPYFIEHLWKRNAKDWKVRLLSFTYGTNLHFVSFTTIIRYWKFMTEQDSCQVQVFFLKRKIRNLLGGFEIFL